MLAYRRYIVIGMYSRFSDMHEYKARKNALTSDLIWCIYLVCPVELDQLYNS